MSPELWRSPLLALAVLLPLGAAWMAVAPDLPPFRGRRALLGTFTWCATRLGFGVLQWWALREGGAEPLPGALAEALAALSGGLPHRDFASPHAALFAPLMGAAVAALGAAGPALLLLAADFGTWRALAAAEGEDGEPAWVWAALPLAWCLTPREGRDELFAAFGVALAWLGLRRDRPGAAGLALGLAALVTGPAMAWLAWPFVAGARRGRAVLAAAALAPPVLLALAERALGADAAQPWRLAWAAPGAGATLGRLAEGFAWHPPAALAWGACVAWAAAGLVLLARRPGRVLAHAVWTFGALAAFAPRFVAVDAVAWTPLLALWSAGDPDRRGWLVVYGALLPAAGALAGPAVHGAWGPMWRLTGMAAILGMAALALWPGCSGTRDPR